MAGTKLYFFNPYKDELLAPWFEQKGEGFVEALKGVSNPFSKVVRVATLQEANAACIPNNFRALSKETEAYIRACVDEAEKAGKPVFIFSCGDFTDTLQFDPRAYVFRYSLYRDTKRVQDISIPTLVEDLGKEGIVFRPKTERPTVSFCGYAGHKTVAQWTKYYLKVLWYKAKALTDTSARARLLGIYWRRTMMAACSASEKVQTRFIVRRAFGAATRTVELDPAQARTEFIDSIVQSDFVLAPKGDGNYSNRFLETLSLGRVPVLLDTNVVLPFEHEARYENVVVRVRMGDVARTPDFVRAWYDPFTPSEWQACQQEARALFEMYLRFDSFFEHFFSTVLPTLPADASQWKGM